MNFRKTGFLFIINLGLVGLILWLQATTQEQPTVPPLVLLFGEDFGAVNQIEIEGKYLSEKRVLRLEADRWVLESPIKWPANEFAMERLFTQLIFLQKDVIFSVEAIKAAGQTLADYGLEDPYLTLTFSTEAHTRQLKLGQSTKIGNRVYMLSPDAKSIWVVSQDLIHSLVGSLEDFRAQDIFNIPLFEIKTIKLKNSETSIATVLEKKEGNWSFETPLKTAADTQIVDTTLAELVAAKASSFLPSQDTDLSKFGLSQPRLVLTIGGDKRKQQLLIGNATQVDTVNSYFAKLEKSPTVFTIDQDTFELFKNAQEAFRDRKILKLTMHDIDHIEISDTSETVVLQKLETGLWQLLEKQSDGKLNVKKAQETIVEALITTLNRMEVTKFVNDAPSVSDKENYGLSEPQKTIKLSGKDTTVIYLGIANDPERIVYLNIKDNPSIYEVDSSVLNKIKAKPLYYRSRLLHELPTAAQIRSVRLINTQTQAVLLNETAKNEGTCMITDTTLYTSQQVDAFNLLIDHIKQFSVHKYLLPPFSLEAYRYKNRPVDWKFKLEVEVYLPGSEQNVLQKYILYFSDRLNGSIQLGSEPSSDSVFLLDTQLIDSLFPFVFKCKLPELYKKE